MFGKIVAFVAGAVIGSLVTYKIVKDRFDEDYARDVAETRAALKKHYAHTEKTNEELKEENKALRTNANIIKNRGYGYTEPIEYVGPETDAKYEPTDDEESEENEIMRPYVITPEDYSDSDYPNETLTYYQDGVVTDEYDNPLDDDQIELWIGRESLNHFGEYEEDSVFVRNEHLNVDYEILQDERTWDDVLAEREQYKKSK